MSLGRSSYSIFAARGRPSRVASATEGSTAKTVNGPVQFSENFALRTLTSVPAFATFQVVAEVL